ncbi:MAG: TIGR00645 family protein [Coriobacteriales bacterium]|jgi:uncharacterized protein (TIGR00645 family)|nr:TIGR00645 family protein [Coriobacteriales bacterium]
MPKIRDTRKDTDIAAADEDESAEEISTEGAAEGAEEAAEEEETAGKAEEEAEEEEEEEESALQKFKGFLEDTTENIIFASRWVLAPVFLGLCLALVAVMVNFIYHLALYIPHFPTMTVDEIAASILSLIDLALLGNLLLIVIFSGYENFVSKINPAQDHEDRPEWMGTLDFSGLKIKIVGSVVAISLVELLQDFIHMAELHADGIAVDPQFELWRVVLHLTFVVSGTLFAVMDLVAEKRHGVVPHRQKRKEKE